MQQQQNVSTKYKKDLPELWSVDDLQRYYEYSSSGFWFTKDTMRFFKTRLTSHFRKLSPEVYLFVTSERNPSGERRSSVRVATFSPADNYAGYKINISTIGNFHGYKTPAAAARAMKKINLSEISV